MLSTLHCELPIIEPPLLVVIPREIGTPLSGVLKFVILAASVTVSPTMPVMVKFDVEGDVALGKEPS